MNAFGKKVLRGLVILSVTALFFVPDMITKRWAEDNLANWWHMLPVVSTGEGGTVGDAVRARFPGMKDSELEGVVLRQPEKFPVKPSDKVHSLESSVGSTVGGFLVYDRDRRFVRRIERNDAAMIKRLVGRAAPGTNAADVAAQVAQNLSDITVRDFILDRIPAESESTVDETIKEALYIIPMEGLEPVSPGAEAAKGATYLLADRSVVVIENFWDYSYVENPAGAFSMLLWVDGKVRLAIFLTFGVFALAALLYMLWKPPSDSWFLTVTLGVVLGGALGNFIDRATLTYVVDFIHMYWKDYHWPRYNIADIGITGGVILLLIFTFLSSPPKKACRKEPPARVD